MRLQQIKTWLVIQFSQLEATRMHKQARTKAKLSNEIDLNQQGNDKLLQNFNHIVNQKFT